MAVADAVSGSRDRYFGNSPSSSRLVVDRAAPDSPIRPSPGPLLDKAKDTSAPAVSDLAVSARVLAGTSAVACIAGSSGAQRNVRTASR